MLLAINTAFLSANVGMCVDGKDYAKTVDAKSKHAEIVLKTIDELCEESKTPISQLKKLYIVVGPGSFTGIRIGVSIAKGLGAVNKNLMVYPVSSLDLIAYIYQSKKKEDITVVLDAHSNLFFVADYDKNGKKITEEKLVEREYLDSIKNKIVCLNGDFSLKNAENIDISTENLLNFAKNSKIEGIAAEKVVPVYIRPSQAESNFKGK